jgi:hypothetical protein
MDDTLEQTGDFFVTPGRRPEPEMPQTRNSGAVPTLPQTAREAINARIAEYGKRFDRGIEITKRGDRSPCEDIPRNT